MLKTIINKLYYKILNILLINNTTIQTNYHNLEKQLIELKSMNSLFV